MFVYKQAEKQHCVECLLNILALSFFLRPARQRAGTFATQRIGKFQITSCQDPSLPKGMFSPGAVTDVPGTVSVSVPSEELSSCPTHLYVSKKCNSLFTFMGFDLAEGGMRGATTVEKWQDTVSYSRKSQSSQKE